MYQEFKDIFNFRCLTGSRALELQGIELGRELHDIDFVGSFDSEKVFNELKDKVEYIRYKRKGDKSYGLMFKYNGIFIDVVNNTGELHILTTYDIPVLHYCDIERYKKAMGGFKHKADIKKIETYKESINGIDI